MAKLLLDAEQLQKAKNNKDFMNSLINSRQAEKFITYVIKTYTGSPAKFMEFNRVEFKELMQLGRIGLFKGIKDCKTNKKTNEIQRYLYLRIQGEIRTVARSNDSNQLVIAQRIRGLYTSYLQYKNKFYEKHFRDPTIEEVMDEFSISREDAFDLVYGMQTTRTDTVETETGTVNLIDLMQMKISNLHNSVEKQVINRITLEEKFKKLKPIERKILEMKFAYGYKKSEISRLLGCSHTMVNKHIRSAFQRLNE